MTLVALIVVAVCLLINRSPYVWFLSISHLIFVFSLDLLAVGYLDSQLVFSTVNSYDFNYFYAFVATSIGLVYFTIVVQKKSEIYHLPLNIKKVKIVGYIFLVLSFCALVVNLSRTNGIALLFINPRLYEATFGQNVLLNYLYFLHLPAGILFVVSYLCTNKLRYALLFLVTMIFSLFHGIKFTILHAFMYPALVYFIYTGFRLTGTFLSLMSTLMFVIILYFYNVRGGEIEGVIGYITSPTTNALYMLTQIDIVSHSPFGVFIPDFGYFISKVNERLLGATMSSAGGDTFVLNESYNLLPAWYSASVLGLYSYVVLLVYVAAIINFIRNRFERTISRAVIESHLYFTLLFSFTGWPLFSLKMIFVIMLFVVIFPLKKVNNMKELGPSTYNGGVFS